MKVSGGDTANTVGGMGEEGGGNGFTAEGVSSPAPL